MRRCRRTLLFLTVLVGLVVGVACTAAEVYRWIDGEGNVVFSDTPVDGAEKIEVKEPTIVPSQPVPRRTEHLAPAPAPGYDGVAIVSPADQQTVRNQRDLSVSIAVHPQLQVDEGHRLQLFFDGSPYGEPARGTQFTITGLERGQHSIGAAIVDGDGHELIRAEPVVIYVHLPSVLHPAPKV